jgi:hypothetical protein
MCAPSSLINFDVSLLALEGLERGMERELPDPSVAP